MLPAVVTDLPLRSCRFSSGSPAAQRTTLFTLNDGTRWPKFINCGICCSLLSGIHRFLHEREARRKHCRTVHSATVDRWKDTQIQAALQLPPQCLQIAPADMPTKENSQLTGDWLPLFRGSAPYVGMFRGSTMVFHIPGYLCLPEAQRDLEGLIGDIALCALLGVQLVLVVSVEHRMLERLRADMHIGGNV